MTAYSTLSGLLGWTTGLTFNPFNLTNPLKCHAIIPTPLCITVHSRTWIMIIAAYCDLGQPRDMVLGHGISTLVP